MKRKHNFQLYILLPVFLFFFRGQACWSSDWLQFHGGLPNNPVVQTPLELPVYFNWRFNAGERIDSGIVISGQKAVFGAQNDTVYCINAESGELIWSYPADGFVDSTPAISDGTVIAATRKGSVYCLSLENGSLRWKLFLNTMILGSPKIAGSRIFLGAGDGNFYCLALSNGEILWKYSAGQPIYSTPAIDSAAVYFSDTGGRVHSVSCSTGERRWTFKTQGLFYVCSPLLYDGKLFFAPAVMDPYLYCLNASDGKLLWTYPSGGGSGAPKKAPSEKDSQGRLTMSYFQRLSISSKNMAKSGAPLLPGLKQAPKAPSGSKSAGYFVDDNLKYASISPVISNGKLYYITGYPEAVLYCLNLSTKTVSWQKSLKVFNEPLGYFPAPLVRGNQVYVYSYDKNIFILDGSDGVELARLGIEGIVTGSMAPAEKSVLIPTHDGYVYSMKPYSIDLASDKTPPEITILRPQAGSTVKYPRPSLFATVLEVGTRVDPGTVRVKLDNQDIVFKFDYIANKVSAVPSFDLTDGVHSFYVEAADIAGNTGRATVNFTVNSVSDITPPTITIISPPEFATVTDTRRPLISARITDSGSGVNFDALTIGVDGRIITPTVDESSGIISYHSPVDFSEGIHKVVIKAFDYRGNYAHAEWVFNISSQLSPFAARQVRISNIDSSSATVSWLTVAPAAGKVVYATDPEFTDGVAVEETTASLFTHKVDLRNLAPGKRYYFIISNMDIQTMVWTDNGGDSFTFTTASDDSQGTSRKIKGFLKDADGRPVVNALVYMSAYNLSGDFSTSLLALSDLEGGFELDVGKLRGLDGKLFEMKRGVFLNIYATDGQGLVGFKSGLEFQPDSSIPEITVEMKRTIDYPVKLLPGLNFMSLPVITENPLPSKKLFDSLSSLLEVSIFEPAGQILKSTFKLGGLIRGEEFSIFPGQGIVLRAGELAELVFSGVIAEFPVAIELLKGFNLVAFPYGQAMPDNPLTGYDAYSLLRAVPSLSEVTTFDAGRQMLVSAFRFRNDCLGSNFKVRAGEGYLLRALENVTFTPERIYQEFIISSGAPLLAHEMKPEKEEARKAAYSSRISAASSDLSGRTQRGGSLTVSNRRILDISPTKAVFYCETDIPAKVIVIKDGRIFYDLRGMDYSGNNHYIEVTGLKPLEKNRFGVEATAPFATTAMDEIEVVTPEAGGPGRSFVFAGRILDTVNEPVSSVMVEVTLESNGKKSVPLVALTDKNGEFYVNLGNLRDSSTLEILEWQEGDRLDVTVSEKKTGHIFFIHGESPLVAGDIIIESR